MYILLKTCLVKTCLVKTCLVLNLFLSSFVFANSLVMISPAGNVRNPGRPLDNGYERGVAFNFSERLKSEISERYDVNCVLTRKIGEDISNLQSVSLANRLGASLYLSINFYYEESIKPKVAIYYLVYNPLKDFAKKNATSFIPVNESHFGSIGKTVEFTGKIYEILSGEEYHNKLDVLAPVGLPYKPFMGITVPAIAIDIGLNRESMWESLLEPVSDSLRFLFSF